LGGKTNVPPEQSVQKIPTTELSKEKEESNKKAVGFCLKK